MFHDSHAGLAGGSPTQQNQLKHPPLPLFFYIHLINFLEVLCFWLHGVVLRNQKEL